MLQDIRKTTQGTAAKVVIGLIVISFALFGIESILLGGGGGAVAEGVAAGGGHSAASVDRHDG